MGVMPLVAPSMMAGRVTPAPTVAQAAPVSADAASRFASLVESKMSGSMPALSATVAEGDSILQGLERLRTSFNAQELRISELMSGAYSDTDTMLAMQMEMTNYSILIDMTSKLASKAAQGIDTLMKGS